TLVVVEGYLDCIALHQAGFENAVASLGTAFTEKQARELRKYADGIFLCFDGDAAGGAAAAKAIDIAVKAMENAGSSVRIVSLPSGEDPDTFVRSKGAPAFAELLQAAKPAIEVRLEREVERLQRGFDSPAKLASAAEALIQRMTPKLEWDRWRVWIAKRLKVNENDLRNSRFLANTANFTPRSAGVAPATRHLSHAAQPSTFERDVLSIVLEEPALLQEYRERIPADCFRTAPYRRIYAVLAQNADRLVRPADVFAMFADDNESVGLLTSLGQPDRSSTVRYEDSEQRRAHLERVVERLQLDEQRRRYQELSRRIDEMLTNGQNVSTELRDEFDALVTQLKK
ncbi:MAG TPA: toprim domain-containing protein, partial [Candidatus Baltobacteraceae bacterium]|nr:toprim domain-containing protein [Candidatus Baltobacteraceae bacterium]